MGLKGCMYTMYVWVCIYVWLANRHVICSDTYVCMCAYVDMCIHLSTCIYACTNEMSGYDCVTTQTSNLTDKTLKQKQETNLKQKQN